MKWPDTLIQGLPNQRNKNMVDDNQDKQPSFVTEEGLHTTLNGALAAQKKEMQKMMTQQSQQFQQLLESFNKNFGPPPETPPVPSKAAIAEDTTALKQQVKLLLEEREKQQTELKHERLQKNLRDNLVKHGISDKADIAIKYLQDQVSYDEDGQLVMQVEITPGVVQPLALAEAVAKFAQTDNGKFLANTRDIKGSGSGSITNPNKQQAATATSLITGNSNGQAVFKDAKALRQYAAGALDKSVKY